MATSTINTTSGGTDRDNSALYWGIGIAILVVIGIIYAVSTTNQRTDSAGGAGTSVSSPVGSGTSAANPAAGSTRSGDTGSALGTGTTNSGAGSTNPSTDTGTGNNRPNPEAAGTGADIAPGGN